MCRAANLSTASQRHSQPGAFASSHTVSSVALSSSGVTLLSRSSSSHLSDNNSYYFPSFVMTFKHYFFWTLLLLNAARLLTATHNHAVDFGGGRRGHRYAAKVRSFQLLSSRTADLRQCSTCFIMIVVSITLITHVPSSPLEAVLDMYKFMPLPIPVHDQYHTILRIIDTVLAIAPSEVIFRFFTAFNLSQCDKFGVYHICHEGNVMRKSLPAMKTGHHGQRCVHVLVVHTELRGDGHGM